MFGNLLQVSGVTDRLAKTASEAFMDILTILLGLAIGGIMTADNFLRTDTLKIFVLGIVAFAAATAFGVLIGKLMNKFSKDKPHDRSRRGISSADVSQGSATDGTKGESEKLPPNARYGAQSGRGYRHNYRRRDILGYGWISGMVFLGLAEVYCLPAYYPLRW